MYVRGKKFLALFLVFCLVALSGNLTAQEKKGVRIIVEINNGQTISGELITVKRDSLLLLDSETLADMSVKIDEIKTILVNNKSRILELGVAGALLGVATQGLTGKTDREVEGTTQKGEELTTKAVPSFMLFGSIGLGVGALLGTVIGINKTIQIQGRSDADIQQDLEKLSKKARVKGIQ